MRGEREWFIKEVRGKFYIYVREPRAKDGSAPKDRPHTMHGSRHAKGFVEHEDAIEALEALEQSYEEAYERYLEDNHEALAWQERYEAYRNEQ